MTRRDWGPFGEYAARRLFGDSAPDGDDEALAAYYDEMADGHERVGRVEEDDEMREASLFLADFARKQARRLRRGGAA
jgi:hypothetical protein